MSRTSITPFRRGLAADPEERALVKRVHAAMTAAGNRGRLLWQDDRDQTCEWLTPNVLYEPSPTRDWLLAFARAFLAGSKYGEAPMLMLSLDINRPIGERVLSVAIQNLNPDWRECKYRVLWRHGRFDGANDPKAMEFFVLHKPKDGPVVLAQKVLRKIAAAENSAKEKGR